MFFDGLFHRCKYIKLFDIFNCLVFEKLNFSIIFAEKSIYEL